MEKWGKIKFIIFLIFLLIVIIGGYIFMDYMSKSSKNDSSIKNETKENVDIRLDKKKEYIYFENVNRIVDELDIEYKDIILNFAGGSLLQNELNNETKAFNSSLKYDETSEDAAYNKLVGASYKKYDVNYYENYISLIVNYYSFEKEKGVIYEQTKAYTFLKDNGNLMSNEDLLNKYEISKNEISDLITVHLEDQQLLKTEEKLDIEKTLEINNDYNLYIDKMGKLCVSILVKSDQNDYNEIILLK